MAGGVGEERRREGGESSPRKMATLYPPENATMTRYVSWMTHLLMAMTGLGYLALTWSTVVLLGGFVTALQRKDFWCLTVISMLQAARIFNDLGDELIQQFSSLLIGSMHRCVSVAQEWIAFQTYEQQHIPTIKLPKWLRILSIVGLLITVHLPTVLLVPVSYMVVFLYGYGGPAVCIGLALWRIVQRDYGSNDNGDVTKANLAPALVMFYGLILCQGVLYLIWLFFYLVGAGVLIAEIRQDFKLPREFSNVWLVDYLFDARARCWRDSASIQGRTISVYAVNLIDSESREDIRSGAMMLATFIRQGADIRSLLLLSRPRVQKLIDILGWRMAVDSEMGQAAAILVAHLAGDIHLSQFPGAIRCISTLLQDEYTTQTYRWKSNQQHVRPHHHTHPRSTILAMVRWFEVSRAQRKRHEEGDDAKVIGVCNEVILQGLTILERLASDQHNCMEICTSPGLLPKIMAPLCSRTLTLGVKSTAWAEVVNGSLKVLYRLMRCSGPTGTSLRWQISGNKQAICNLESFLSGQSNVTCHQDQELQMRAMEILTELALDVSINLNVEMKQRLMKKQLEIFLDQESAAISKRLRATAGRTLALLSANSEEVCSAIVRDHFYRLTEVLDATYNITFRMIAARILENICAHCGLDKNRMKDALLPKVLKGILSTEREQPQSDEEKKKKSAAVDDEESQNKCSPPGDYEHVNDSAYVDNADIKKISSTANQNNSSDHGNDEQIATEELQESFLSLILVIYDKLISTNDFDDVVQKQDQGSPRFVLKLKTIVEDNCKETPTSLRIAKLCGQIAASMMCRNQYTEQFKKLGFVESFSKAKKIMSNLESCILFAGTEFGQKKIPMPFLDELEEKVKELAG